MKKSIRTFLKTAGKDKIARSANPAIVRASTIYFKTMQEMREHQNKISKGKKVSHWDYGRQGSQTTIKLQNIIKELDLMTKILRSNGLSQYLLFLKIYFQANNHL